MIKKIKDPFSYSIGHGAAGISCSDCTLFIFDPSKRDCDEKKRWCKLHNISLNMMVDAHGYLRGEWFCSSFLSSKVSGLSIAEFETIKGAMKEGRLYQACAKEFLHFIDIVEV